MVMAPYNDAARTVQLIEANADDLAAVILEPMCGSGGCILAEPDFLKALRESTARHGVVLVFDEVMTSRLSPGGLQAATGVIPDMTTLGKYLGGGLSFGAFGGRADLMERFDPRRKDALAHAGTFNNNVMTMTAGLTGLRDIYTPEVAVELNASGERLRARLNQTVAKHGVSAHVSGFGSMMMMHPTTEPVRRPTEAAALNPDAKSLMHLEMFARGHYISSRGMMILSLPMTDADLDGLVEAFDDYLGTHGTVLSAAA
jgi:glutamate-1-semialdehyde 2,1-aminomutase